MVYIKEPNSVCKNANCKKLFYACAYCTKTLAWRSVCCSEKCHDQYREQIIESRSKNKKVDLFPDRIDISKEEVIELINKPYEEVIELTKTELSDYIEDIETIGIGNTIDKINKEIEGVRESNHISKEFDDDTIEDKRSRRNKRS